MSFLGSLSEQLAVVLTLLSMTAFVDLTSQSFSVFIISDNRACIRMSMYLQYCDSYMTVVTD